RPAQPGIFSRSTQGGEPHLPIESRLVWGTPAARAFHVPWFPFEFVRQPIDAVSAAFEYNFGPVLRHYTKKSIAVRDPKCCDTAINSYERARPWSVRFKRSENEPSIDGDGENNHRYGPVNRQSITVAAVYDRLIFSADRRVINQQ